MNIDFIKNDWHPKPGEEVYVSHAITKHKFKRCTFESWNGGCLHVNYNGKSHRLHVRHSAMKPIVRVKS